MLSHKYIRAGIQGKWLIPCLFLLILNGCGYALRHQMKEAFTHSKGIFVPVFYNNTDEVGAERVFTDALIRELQSRGEVILSTREKGAYELRGTITGLSYSPTALTDPGYQGLQPYRRIPTEIGVGISISLVLLKPETGLALWSGNFDGFRRVGAPTNRTHDYQAPSSIGLITQSIVESTYSDIAQDIMRDVYDEMVELF